MNKIFSKKSIPAIITFLLIATTVITILSRQTTHSFASTHSITLADNDDLLLGNPSSATANTFNADNYLLRKPQYTLSYNNTKHTANWVSWHLNNKNRGSTNRTNAYQEDNSLPADWYKCTPADYKNSGFDRGHMCPSADRTLSAAANSETFLMTNMIPQAPKNNQITWKHLESFTRNLVSQGNEVYVIAGVHGQGGTGSKGYRDTIGHGIKVPAKVWKIIVVIPNGDNDLERITDSTQVIAVLTPNDQNCSQRSWEDYCVDVNILESLTGYDFLSNVPDNIQNVIESKVFNKPT